MIGKRIIVSNKMRNHNSTEAVAKYEIMKDELGQPAGIEPNEEPDEIEMLVLDKLKFIFGESYLCQDTQGKIVTVGHRAIVRVIPNFIDDIEQHIRYGISKEHGDKITEIVGMLIRETKLIEATHSQLQTYLKENP